MRSPAEIKAAADNEYIVQRIAEGVSAALEQAQQADKANQSTPSNAVTHSASPTVNDRLRELSRLTGWSPPKHQCGCKSAAHAPEAVHVSHGRGPVMQSLRLKS